MDFIEEKSRKIPVYGQYDVVVAGGGVAGIAAALAAKRNGAKTLLIEREYALGGLATLGLVTIYLPICDGCGRQVSFGIAEELLKLSIKYGHDEEPPRAWLENGTHEEKLKMRYRASFNAQLFAIAAEEKLISEGVDILYGTTVCAVNVEDKKVTSLVIENKSGRQAITVGSVVDCTGDADIFALGGAKTAKFGQGNILAAWYYSSDNGKYELHPVGCCDVPDNEKDKRKGPELLANQRFEALSGEELTRMTELSHAEILKRFIKEGNADKTHALATIATIPQVRMTRRPVGAYTLDYSEDHKYFEDSIGLISDWRRPGPIFEVPFGCLYGNDLKNVAAAGRCISNTDAMWDVTRVIPCCSVTGEAAGTAAAMSDDFPTLDVEKLQQRLAANGVVLHI